MNVRFVHDQRLLSEAIAGTFQHIAHVRVPFHPGGAGARHLSEPQCGHRFASPGTGLPQALQTLNSFVHGTQKGAAGSTGPSQYGHLHGVLSCF
jgi:hypothetical protein